MKKQLTKFALSATLGLAITLTLNACEEKGGGGTFTDERDGKKYKTTKIGEQVWMAENLNYAEKGSKCGGTELKTGEGEEGEYTYYLFVEENTVNCNKYGRLYNWETAKSACPKSWHLPNTKEWQTLVDFAGGDKIAGKKLKAKSGWNDFDGKSGNGTDNYGFSALPGGHSDSNADFNFVGEIGNWWSATESDADHVYSRLIYNYSENNNSSNNNDKSDLRSVRCIQN